MTSVVVILLLVVTFLGGAITAGRLLRSGHQDVLVAPRLSAVAAGLVGLGCAVASLHVFSTVRTLDRTDDFEIEEADILAGQLATALWEGGALVALGMVLGVLVAHRNERREAP